MLALNIISTFIIGFMSFIGIQIPNFIDKNNNYLNNLKIFSCGIIISTGFIHMINEGQLELYKLDIDYPVANLITGLTIICIITLEDLLFYLIKLNKINNDSNNSTDNDSNNSNDNDSNNSTDNDSTYPIQQKSKEVIHKPLDAIYRHHVHESIIDKELCEINICNNEYTSTIPYNTSFVSYNASFVSYNADLHIKNYIILHLLEFGIAIHSVIIGISLGLLDDVIEQIILLIVISLHQLFEGISIGNGLLNLYKLPRWHYIFMVLIFILTTPIGICIGILISKEYSDNLLVTGILNCISGGLLIYTGINNLINISNKTLTMHGLLFLGFTCMSILGIWS